jgi:hypothetical protein
MTKNNASNFLDYLPFSITIDGGKSEVLHLNEIKEFNLVIEKKIPNFRFNYIRKRPRLIQSFHIHQNNTYFIDAKDCVAIGLENKDINPIDIKLIAR